jgi:hypothetical protein
VRISRIFKFKLHRIQSFNSFWGRKKILKNIAEKGKEEEFGELLAVAAWS